MKTKSILTLAIVALILPFFSTAFVETPKNTGVALPTGTFTNATHQQLSFPKPDNIATWSASVPPLECSPSTISFSYAIAANKVITFTSTANSGNPSGTYMLYGAIVNEKHIHIDSARAPFQAGFVPFCGEVPTGEYYR